MQVVCIKAFGLHEPGATAEVPDGASVDPEHYRPVAAVASPSPADAPKPPAPVTPATAVTPKEGM